MEVDTGITTTIKNNIAIVHSDEVIITGDFSGYTSKPLHDYIYECNQGIRLNFVASEEEAIRQLSV